MSGLLHDSGRTTRRWTAAGVLAVGAVVLSITLRLPRGSPEFVVASIVLAATWSTPTVLFGARRGRHGRRDWPLDVIIGAVVGSAMYGLFVVGVLVARQVSWLDGPARHILDKADAGPTAVIIAVALVNGVAEELFFRGSLIEALDETRPVAYLGSFVVYVGVTALVGNTALTVAAVVMGAVLTVERRLTGALTAAITTHVVWSFLVIVALPRA